MQYTTNKNLKKPDTGDRVQIGDINFNSDLLDLILTAITDVLDGYFLVAPYTVEGETTKIFKIQRKDTDEFTIVEVRAPEDNSKEATLALMLPKGDGVNPYFVDLSMMTYGEVPRAAVVMQTRGGVLYPLYIAFNSGSGAYTTAAFKQDGTFELVKDTPTDNRKFKLGGYGVIQDRLKDANAELAQNRRTCLLFNCYVSADATNTYTRLNNWVDCYKLEFDGTENTGGLALYRVAYGSGTFTDSAWSLIFKISPAGVISGAGNLSGSATYDPPSLAAGATTTTTVTVIGAAVGDFAQAAFSNVLQGIKLFSEVTAANTVTVTFWNQTAGTVDLASGTLKVRVVKG